MNKPVWIAVIIACLIILLLDYIIVVTGKQIDEIEKEDDEDADGNDNAEGM